MPDPVPFHTGVADAPSPALVTWLHADDGIRLRAAFWQAGPKGMVVLFPGRTEVIEKYGRVVRDLVTTGYGVAVIDWRGQGLSDRPGGKPLLGHVDDFALFQQDVAAYLAAIDTFAPDAKRFVLAHSMGGCIALRALCNGFPASAGAFSAPMWGLPLNKLTKHGLRAMTSALRLAGMDQREVPGAGIEFRLWENPFDTNELTGDAEMYRWMQTQVQAHADLRLGAPSLRWLVAALAEMAVLTGLPSPALPAFCGLGTRELLVSPEAIRARMGVWPNGRLEVYDGALHELMMERSAIRSSFMAGVLDLFDTTATIG